MKFSDIQQKIQNAPMLDFGDIFNESIELFKKVWLQGLIMILLSFAFAIPFIIIIYFPLIALGIADAFTYGSYADLAPFAVFFMIITYLFFIFVMIVVSLGLKTALYKIMRQKETDSTEKDDYFFYLRRNYLSKTINLSLAYLGITLLATLLCFLPVIYVIVPLNLLVVIYAFNLDMSSSELIKASFELGNKKWLITFGLLIVSGILAQIVGSILCGIGIFFTACFAYIPPYFIYKKVIGFHESSLEVIGTEDVE